MDNEKSVGTILKEARLAKGLSLMDIEKGTSIRCRYLEAVENDEYDKTPGEVFLKGIIRNYGNFLGLDGLELVTMYKASAAGIAAEAARSQGIREVDKVHLNIQLKETRDIGSGTGKFEMPALPIKQIAAGVAVLAILAAGYFAIPAAINYVKNMPKDEPKQTQQVQTETKTAAVMDKVVVELEAEGSCWLEAVADGKELFSGTMQPKEKKTFEAKDKLVIKYGNIGAMKIKVNGELVDLKGEHGVAEKTYTPFNAAAASENKAQQQAEPEPSAPQQEVKEETAPPVSEPAPAAPQAEAQQAAKPEATAANTASEAEKAAPAQETEKK